MTEKNKIILSAETELEDKLCREILNKLITKIDTINERTKLHTREIQELQKKLDGKNKI
jgi:hypothetical protein